MVMTNQIDFLDIIFGEKAGTVSDDGGLNIYIPSQRELDQQLNLEDVFDNSDLTLVPNFIEDAFLADDNCVPIEEVVTDVSSDTSQTPSTSGSQQQEQLVFQYPPYIENDSFQMLLASDNFMLNTEIPPTSPSSPFSPNSSYSGSYTESLPPPTPDTASSMDSVSTHIPTFLRKGLKDSILEKRRQQGKGEIKVEFIPPPPEKLTAEEEERRKTKRERNKMAAQKCRSKKRAIADVLEDETKVLEKERSKYKLEIKQLIEERDHLMDILKIHGDVCPAMKAKLRIS